MAQLGPARAGSTAQADNAATAGTNPAGLTRVPNEQWVGGTMLAYSNAKFEVKPGTTVPGGDPKNDNDIFAIPSAYYSRPLSEDLRVGFAFFVPTGIGSDYGGRWSGRYLADSSSLVFVNFSPGIAYRLNEQWSVGASVSLIYSESESTVRVRNPEPFLGDGRMQLEMRGWGLGGGLGVLYEYSQATRFGLSYSLPSEWKSSIPLSESAPVR